MAAEAFWESPQARAAVAEWNGSDGNSAHFLTILINYLDKREAILTGLDEHHLTEDEVAEIRKRVLDAGPDGAGPVQRAEVRKLAMRGLSCEQIGVVCSMAQTVIAEHLSSKSGKPTPAWYRPAISLAQAGLSPSEIERQLRPEHPTCRRQNVHRVLREAGLLAPKGA